MNHSNILWIFLGGILFIVILSQTGLLHLDLLPQEDEVEEVTKDDGVKNGEVKTYDKYGNLHTLVTYNQGVKEGKSYIYYKNGQVMLEMIYADGKREGESRKYFENGKLYAITPYSNDELNGVRKTYYQTGQLKAEIPYLHSQPGTGLTEYDKDGNVKSSPEIKMQRLVRGEKSFLYFKTPDCNKVRFYTGALFNNRYLIPDPEYVNILPMEGQQGYLDITATVSPINIICECTTRSGYPFITRLVYNPN